ncbi:MAG: histidine phosphatase family protein [bacterium]|nr:histidine phosphatase family protein [bacterium]
MIKIIFESHSTSLDNEDGLSSGHFDVDLSELGERQAWELGQRYKDNKPDVVFCSDLKRSFHTARLAFEDSVAIIQDARLREVDYGDLTKQPSSEVEPAKKMYIDQPFPNGQSYTQTTEKMKEFLEELKESHEGKTVLIIGHRATQYALENLINKIDLRQAVTAPWAWRPGWTYFLN